MTPSEQKAALDKIARFLRGEYQSDVMGADEALTILDEIAAEIPQWRPIDTCPADTCVLMFCPDTGLTNDERIESGIYHCTRGGYRHAWATHWMSLPKPPKEGE